MRGPRSCEELAWPSSPRHQLWEDSGGPCRAPRWRPKLRTASGGLSPSPFPPQTWRRSNAGRRLHAPTAGISCLRRSRAVYSHSRAWSFPGPIHAQPRPSCRRRSIRPPRGSLAWGSLQGILRSLLPDDKPGRIRSHSSAWTSQKAWRMWIADEEGLWLHIFASLQIHLFVSNWKKYHPKKKLKKGRLFCDDNKIILPAIIVLMLVINGKSHLLTVGLAPYGRENPPISVMFQNLF